MEPVAATNDAVTLRDYVDAIRAHTDHEVATTDARLRDLIQAERAFVVAILAEHQRAMELAERERDRAASLLRRALEQQILEGDANLHQHIKEQVAQVATALASAESIILHQFATVEKRMDGMADLSGANLAAVTAAIAAQTQAFEQRLLATQREAHLIQEASQSAITKAEVATEKRFEAVNAFRAQLTDQASRFLLREVAETQFAELRRALADLTEKVGKVV